MTRLFVHTGAPTCRTADVQAALLAAREPLAAAGVRLLPGSDPDAWDRAVRQAIGGASPQPLHKTLTEEVKAGGEGVWVSSEAAFRPLRRGRLLGQLRDFAADCGAGLTVVMVVREQLSLLNALYASRVVSLQTTDGFDAFVDAEIQSEAYAYPQSFRALLDATDVAFVAVPYSRIATGAPLPALLREAGLTADLGDLPAGPEVPAAAEPPGPVQVLAALLVQKRLQRLSVIDPVAKSLANEVAQRLATSATENGWDDAPYWGWSPERAQATARRFRHGNAEFAVGAWGADWPDEPPNPRALTAVDLASRSPAVVRDVIDAVDAAVETVLGDPRTAGKTGKTGKAGKSGKGGAAGKTNKRNKRGKTGKTGKAGKSGAAAKAGQGGASGNRPRRS